MNYFSHKSQTNKGRDSCKMSLVWMQVWAGGCGRGFVCLVYCVSTWERVSCSGGWPQIPYIVRDKLELLQLLYLLILAGITGVCHHVHAHDAIHRAGLGESTRVSCMLGKVRTLTTERHLQSSHLPCFKPSPMGSFRVGGLSRNQIIQ